MTLLKFIAPVARRMPYFINRLRFFKHAHKWPRFRQKLEDKTLLIQFNVENYLKNRNNARWALMADKYRCREEVERILGPGHLTVLAGVWDNPEDIDFDSLPNSFVLKTNNGCGTNIFVNDKNKANRADIVAKLKRSLAYPYADLTGQPHYRLIKPCVIAEELLEANPGSTSVIDYKIHCVDGNPQLLIVFKDRAQNSHFDYRMQIYTCRWQLIGEGETVEDAASHPQASDCPPYLDDLLEAARRLSAGEKYVRVDLYYSDGKVIFGEMTYSPDTYFNPAYRKHQPALKSVLDAIKNSAENDVEKSTD